MENEYQFLGPLTNDKIVPDIYTSIPHLPISVRGTDDDNVITPEQDKLLTKKLRCEFDKVIITEKMDGMFCAVIRINDKLFPVTRDGYDIRNDPNDWSRAFAKYIDIMGMRFMALLEDGEMVCGEWLLKTHRVQYNFTKQPNSGYDIFMAFDIIKDNIREPYDSLSARLHKVGITMVRILRIRNFPNDIRGVPTLIALNDLYEYDKKFPHCCDGFEPEGVVYRYETYDPKTDKYKYEFSAKLITNHMFIYAASVVSDDNIYNIHPMTISFIKNRSRNTRKESIMGIQYEYEKFNKSNRLPISVRNLITICNSTKNTYAIKFHKLNKPRNLPFTQVDYVLAKLTGLDVMTLQNTPGISEILDLRVVSVEATSKHNIDINVAYQKQ